MSATSQASSVTAEQLDAVVHRLNAQVRLQIPDLQCRIHHGANDRFAWWVVARLSSPKDESKTVDVSIECRSAESSWNIHADLAREDGTVLQELPADGLTVPPRSGVNGELPADVIQRVEEFLLGQVECIVAELT